MCYSLLKKKDLVKSLFFFVDISQSMYMLTTYCASELSSGSLRNGCYVTITSQNRMMMLNLLRHKTCGTITAVMSQRP
jgi:hypothetical protein